METSEFSLGALIQSARGHVASQEGVGRFELRCLLDATLPDKLIGDRARIGEVLEGLVTAGGSLPGVREVTLAIFPARVRQPDLELTFEITPSFGTPWNTESATQQTLDLLRLETQVETFRRPAESLGGELGLHAQKGRGPAIWCRIPVQQSDVDHGHAVRQVSSPESSVGAKFPVKILMAEDNSINQRVGKLILQRAGYKIDLVSDGNEALEAHRHHGYDLILMDCQMPVMDGFEATRQIRSLAAPQPVIIAVTANALVGERERCLAAGMNDYLSKPFQAEQLVSIVEKWAEESLKRS